MGKTTLDGFTGSSVVLSDGVAYLEYRHLSSVMLG